MTELETPNGVGAIAPAMAPEPGAGPTNSEAEPPTARMAPEPSHDHSGILAIPIDLELVLATVRMPVSRLMDLAPGAEIDLDSLSSGEVKLLANGALFAVGELFLLDSAEKRVGLRIKRLAGGAR
jgi:flagellar motor switch/type III secretory pathway protein FliN